MNDTSFYQRGSTSTKRLGIPAFALDKELHEKGTGYARCTRETFAFYFPHIQYVTEMMSLDVIAASYLGLNSELIWRYMANGKDVWIEDGPGKLKFKV